MKTQNKEDEYVHYPSAPNFKTGGSIQQKLINSVRYNTYMSKSFTIKIYVPDGDPKGLRIIDRPTSPNKFICFPRRDWQKVKRRDDLHGAGIYILAGYGNDDQTKTIYVGEGIKVSERINSHYKNKDFWDSAIVFTSDSDHFNQAHIKWLEYALMKRLNEIGQSNVENGNTPNEPPISESEKADMQVFLEEIYQTLPLAGLLAFELPRKISVSKHAGNNHVRNTIVVPAKEDGFERVFLGENSWHSIRISGGMLDKIKYIAAYQSKPISAITHYAEVSSIETIGDEGKYKLNFASPAKELSNPISLKNSSPNSAIQSARYTTFEKLMSAKTLDDL